MRKCPSCGKAWSGDSLLCETCARLPTVAGPRDELERRLELRAEELAAPWKKSTMIFGALLIVLTVAWSLISYFGIPGEIRKQVEEKMTEPHIAAAAQTAATNSVSEFVGHKLQPMERLIDKWRIDLSWRQDQISNVLEQSQATLVSATNALRLLELVTLASAFDGHAFEELAAIELSTNKPQNAIASLTRRNVQMMLQLLQLSKKGFDLSSSTNEFNPSTASFEDYKSFYAITGSIIEKCIILSYMVSQARFNKTAVFDYLYELPEFDGNLLVRQHVVGLTGNDPTLGPVLRKFNMRWDTSDVKKWWQTNRASFVAGSLTNPSK